VKAGVEFDRNQFTIPSIGGTGELRLVYSALMDQREIPSHGKAFESFKQAAMYSLLWACFGAFLLGVMVGLILAK
jgi:hypothetical protein